MRSIPGIIIGRDHVVFFTLENPIFSGGELPEPERLRFALHIVYGPEQATAILDAEQIDPSARDAIDAAVALKGLPYSKTQVPAAVSLNRPEDAMLVFDLYAIHSRSGPRPVVEIDVGRFPSLPEFIFGFIVDEGVALMGFNDFDGDPHVAVLRHPHHFLQIMRTRFVQRETALSDLQLLEGRTYDERALNQRVRNDLLQLSFLQEAQPDPVQVISGLAATFLLTLIDFHVRNSCET